MIDAKHETQSPNYGYLPDLVGHLLSLAHVRSTSLCLEALSHLRLTPKQAVTLYFISENENAMQKDLAAGVGTSPTVMVGILDTLEVRGFIKRKNSKQDRRSQTVKLTAKGKTNLPKLKEAFFSTEQELSAQVLSKKERKQLLELLRKLTHREVKR